MRSGATREHPLRQTRNILLTAAVIVVVVAIAGISVIHHYWPFTESAVRADLASAAAANVQFAHFHDTYFPPGCVAEDVVFQREGSDHPLITVRRLTIRSYLGGMVHGHVSLIRAEGMHVILSGSAFRSGNPQGHQRTIDRLVADDAVLELPRKSAEGSMRFVFHRFMMKNLSGDGPVSFSAVFENPMPRGVIQTEGRFGPWNDSHPDEMPVEGKYSLENADMSVFGGVGGNVSSTGSFQGTFKNLAVVGKAKMPELEVTKTGHGLPLNVRFEAEVNAAHGDVILHQVEGNYGRNDIAAQGKIGRGPSGKRSAVLDLRCQHGRIEDVFFPFIHAPKPPLTGDVAFRMKVTIPSGHEKFEEKVQVRSDFEIQNARFTHTNTQEHLNKIAEEPGQKNPTETVADFRGTVTLDRGVAHFSYLSVHDQGAVATFRGSYNLLDEHVNMHGQLKTATSLTKTTNGGVSAVFAKVLEPFFKKKPHETVVPVKIGGTYEHPSFGLNM